MLVIVAGRGDRAAQALAARWNGDAAVLTARDLGIAGWRHGSGQAVAVVDGERVAVNEVDGVVSRLPAVTEAELGFIVTADRSYVAAEMTAFLAAWLAQLRCPVLNRPSPTYLMGRPWPVERWLLTAARMGIPTLPLRRAAPEPQEATAAAELVSVCVVGGRAVGDGGPVCAAAAESLAAAAGAELLRAWFDGGAFAGADYWVDVEEPGVADALALRLAVRGAA